MNPTDSDTAAAGDGAAGNDAVTDPRGAERDTVRLVIPDSIDLVAFFGPGESNLRALEKTFDDLDIHVRANQVQVTGDPKRVESFVSVIGVNLSQTAEFFAAAGLPHGVSVAGHLGRALPPDAPRRLAESLSRHFIEDADLKAFYREGFSPLRADYLPRCVNLGRQVWFEGGEGVAETVDEQGRLVVAAEGGLRHVLSGEVSVKGIYGRV